MGSPPAGGGNRTISDSNRPEEFSAIPKVEIKHCLEIGSWTPNFSTNNPFLECGLNPDTD